MLGKIMRADVAETISRIGFTPIHVVGFVIGIVNSEVCHIDNQRRVFRLHWDGDFEWVRHVWDRPEQHVEILRGQSGNIVDGVCCPDHGTSSCLGGMVHTSIHNRIWRGIKAGAGPIPA